MRGILGRLAAAAQRRILGISAEEIRYTFEDVRAELRAVRSELREELQALRKDVERLEARAEGKDRGEEEDDDEPVAQA